MKGMSAEDFVEEHLEDKTADEILDDEEWVSFMQLFLSHTYVYCMSHLISNLSIDIVSFSWVNIMI